MFYPIKQVMKMETKIMRVVKCGEQFTVKSEKSEN